MHRKVVYAGTFDPVTFGHIDVIKRACKIFDLVIIAVARNPEKNPLFSVEERLEMLKDATKNLENVVVESFDGLAVEYVKKKQAKIIIRGLRMLSDFEYEFQLALTNRKLEPNVETIFMMPNEAYSYLSSKLIKEAVSLGADVKEFVPPLAAKKLKTRLVG